MAAESRKSPEGAEIAASQPSGSLSAEERAQLRARSAVARDYAKAAAARCHELQLKFQARLAEHVGSKELHDRVLHELRESIARYAGCLREQGEAPQRMLVLVKEAVHEVVPIADPDSSAVLDLAVGFAIEAYFETAA